MASHVKETRVASRESPRRERERERENARPELVSNPLAFSYTTGHKGTRPRRFPPPPVTRPPTPTPRPPRQRNCHHAYEIILTLWRRCGTLARRTLKLQNRIGGDRSFRNEESSPSLYVSRLNVNFF